MRCKCLDLLGKTGTFSYVMRPELNKFTVSDNLKDLGNNIYIDKNSILPDSDNLKDLISYFKEYVKSMLCECVHSIIDNTPIVLCNIYKNKSGYKVNNNSIGGDLLGLTMNGLIFLDLRLLIENPSLMKTVFFHEVSHLLDVCSRCPVEKDSDEASVFSDKKIFIQIHNLLSTNPGIWRQFLHDYKNNIIQTLKELNLDNDVPFEENWFKLAKDTETFLKDFLDEPAEVFACFNHFICADQKNGSIFINWVNIKAFFEQIFLNIYTRRDPNTAVENTKLALDKMGIVFAKTFQAFILKLFEQKLTDICLPYIKSLKLIKNCKETYEQPRSLALKFTIEADNAPEAIINGEPCPVRYRLVFDMNPTNGRYCCNKTIKNPGIGYIFPLFMTNECKCYQNSDKKCYLLITDKFTEDSIKNPVNNLSYYLHYLYNGCVGIPFDNNNPDYKNHAYLNPISNELIQDFHKQLKEFLAISLKIDGIDLINEDCELLSE